jgi:hypothetical protein
MAMNDDCMTNSRRHPIFSTVTSFIIFLFLIVTHVFIIITSLEVFMPGKFLAIHGLLPFRPKLVGIVGQYL